MSDRKFERRGRVVKVEPLAGNFAQVTVRCGETTMIHTCGFSGSTIEARNPRVGETIVVSGVIRNNRYLISDWRTAT